MTPRIITAGVLLAGLVLTGAACQQDEGERTGDFDPEAVRERRAQMPAEIVAALDSGNRAYRAGRYEEAREHFDRALQADSSTTAAWFGVYMVEQALGDEEAAQRALERAGTLAEEGTEAPQRPPPADTGAG